MTVIGYISTHATRGQISRLPPMDFDAVITVVSWESRCHSILTWEGLSSDYAFILRFASTPTSDPEKWVLKAKNGEVLINGISRVAKQHVVLELPKSTAMSQGFHLISAQIGRLAKKLNRRVRVCIDLSSMPRSMICFLLLCCFKESVVDFVTCFFAISDHSESVDLVATERVTGLATSAPYVEGRWELMSVPYGEGRITGGRNDNIIVSVGLDTYQILDVIERIEPANALFLIPMRLDGSRIDEVAKRQLTILTERFGSEFRRRAYQTRSVAPYDLDWIPEIAEFMKSRFSDRESSILLYPFGPKVHSVGLSLLALQRDDIAVIGRTPTSYFKRSVEPTGEAEVISLTDLSSLTSRAFSRESESLLSQ